MAQVSSFLELQDYTWSLLDQIARFGTLHRCLCQSWLWHFLHGPLACRSNASSHVSSDPLTHHLAFLQSQAITDSTRRSYQAGIHRYSTFCTSVNWQSFPATETTLCFFAAYPADQVSFKTIKLYLTGICFAHTENVHHEPLFTSAAPYQYDSPSTD